MFNSFRAFAASLELIIQLYPRISRQGVVRFSIWGRIRNALYPTVALVVPKVSPGLPFNQDPGLIVRVDVARCYIYVKYVLRSRRRSPADLVLLISLPLCLSRQGVVKCSVRKRSRNARC